MAADLSLHRELVGAAGSPRLSRVFDALAGEFLLLLAQVRLQYTGAHAVLVEQHRELVRALRSGDEGVAIAAVRAHLEQSMEECLAGARSPAADVTGDGAATGA